MLGLRGTLRNSGCEVSGLLWGSHPRCSTLSRARIQAWTDGSMFLFEGGVWNEVWRFLMFFLFLLVGFCGFSGFLMGFGHSICDLRVFGGWSIIWTHSQHAQEAVEQADLGWKQLPQSRSRSIVRRGGCRPSVKALTTFGTVCEDPQLVVVGHASPTVLQLEKRQQSR